MVRAASDTRQPQRFLVEKIDDCHCLKQSSIVPSEYCGVLVVAGAKHAAPEYTGAGGYGVSGRDGIVLGVARWCSRMLLRFL